MSSEGFDKQKKKVLSGLVKGEKVEWMETVLLYKLSSIMGWWLVRNCMHVMLLQSSDA